MKIISCVAFSALVLVAPAFADQRVDEIVAKANDQLSKGKPEDALKTIQKLGPAPDAQLALGRFQEKLGNIDDALAAYKNAANGATGALKVQAESALADLELRTGPAQTALGVAQDAAQAQPTAETYAILAKILSRIDPVKALQVADQAVAAGATSSAHEARGYALLAQGRNADAEAAFRKALEVDPRFTEARAKLALALLRNHKTTEAVSEARKATTEAPNYAEAHAILGLALDAENPKAWSEAIGEAQDAAFKNPKNPEIQMAVGSLFDADGRLDQAVSAYNQALADDPAYAPASIAIIDAKFKKGDLDGALQDAKKYADAHPDSAEAQFKLGEFLLRKKDFQGALGPLEKAVQKMPGSADANYYLGRTYFETGKVKEALPPYGAACKLAPTNLEYCSTYGLVAAMNQQYDASVEVLQRVVQTPGYKDTAGFTNLGYAYRNMSPPKVQESIAAYKKALDLDPKNAQAALGLGWAYSAAKAWDDCITAYDRLIHLDPKFEGAAYTGMAWAYASKKEYDKARETLEKAAAAGGGDSRLQGILDRIKNQPTIDEGELERQRQAALAEQAKQERVNELLHSQDPGTRAKGVRELVQDFGGESVGMLNWMLSNERDFGVKIAVANGLGTVGAGARKACPYLKSIVAAPIVNNPFASKAEMEQQLLEGDFRKACRDAMARIGCP